MTTNLVRVPADRRITPTRLMEAMRCNYRYGLRYTVGIQPAVTPGPVQVGTLTHAGTEALLLGQKSPNYAIHTVAEKELNKYREYLAELDISFEEEMNAILDMRDRLAPHLAERAVAWFHDNAWEVETITNAKGKKIKLVEHRFDVEVFGVTVSMQPDFVMVNKNTGIRAVWDLKCRQSSQNFATPEVLDTDVQTAFYQYGLGKKYNIEVHGSGILSLLAREPESPKYTQKGTLSRAIDQYPRLEDYKKAMEQQGISLDDPDYQHVLGIIGDRKWEDGILHHRTDEEIERICSEVIGRWEKEAAMGWRAIGSFECRRCWAKDYCLGNLRDEDTDHLIHELEPGVTVDIQGVDYKTVEYTEPEAK